MNCLPTTLLLIFSQNSFIVLTQQAIRKNLITSSRADKNDTETNLNVKKNIINKIHKGLVGVDIRYTKRILNSIINVFPDEVKRRNNRKKLI